MHRFACVVLVDPRGRLLMQERDEHPAIDPEKWSLSGGHVEDGETHEAAAYRELEEETGIRLEPGTLDLLTEVEVFHEAYGTLDTVQVFVAPTDLGDDDVGCREGRRIVFVDPDAVLGLDLSATATAVLPGLLASDTYRRMTR